MAALYINVDGDPGPVVAVWVGADHALYAQCIFVDGVADLGRKFQERRVSLVASCAVCASVTTVRFLAQNRDLT